MIRFGVGFNKEKGFRFFYTFVFGLLGGYTFSLLNLPLSWVLGPMLFTLIFTLTYREAYIPSSCKVSGFFILGISLGLYFVPSTGAVIVDHLKYIVVMSLVTLMLGLINGFLYKKLFKLDWMTVIFGSIPGGLSQMVEIGKELGGKPEIIAIQQTLRIVLVVVIIPTIMFFASDSKPSAAVAVNAIEDYSFFDVIMLIGLGISGIFLGKILRIPIPYFTGPLMIISVISLSGYDLVEMPSILLHLAQVFIGITIGTYFKKSNFYDYSKYLLLGSLSGISLTAMSLLTAVLLTKWGNIDLLTAILSTAPGGVAEMSITAVAIDANVPLVTAFQVIRMVLAVIILPKVIVAISRRVKIKDTLEH